MGRVQIIIESFPPKEAIDCQTASPPTSCRVKSVQNLPTTNTVGKRISSNLPRLAWLKQNGAEAFGPPETAGGKIKTQRALDNCIRKKGWYPQCLEPVVMQSRSLNIFPSA